MSQIETFLLAKIACDHLKLTDDGRVMNWHYSHRRWIEKKPQLHPKSSRAWFAFGKDRTTVYRNRLTWMIVNHMLIPDDCFVDHKDGDRLNDRPDNLQLMKRSDSHRQGNEFQSDTALDSLGRWFEFVSAEGREPVTPEELSWVEVGF